jgi:hypothetical protein
VSKWQEDHLRQGTDLPVSSTPRLLVQPPRLHFPHAEKEVFMNPITHTILPALSFDMLNWTATDAMQRDKEQSHRLHEPEKITSTTDPITGVDIKELSGHPYIKDGNVVIYFESEETRKAFQDIPIDHPFRLQDNPYEEGEAEG